MCGDVEANPGPGNQLNSQGGTAGVLSLLHLNIRSVRNKLNYIFDNLTDFNIMCFTESHLDEHVSDDFLLCKCTNYKLFRKDVSSHSGGVLIFIPVEISTKR